MVHVWACSTAVRRASKPLFRSAARATHVYGRVRHIIRDEQTAGSAEAHEGADVRAGLGRDASLGFGSGHRDGTGSAGHV